MTTVNFTRLDHMNGFDSPAYATDNSAGLDLCAAVHKSMILEPGQRDMVPTGIAIELPVGFEAQIRPRSGLAAKHGVTVLNTPGTIDADYRGELKVILINHGQENFTIEPGMRIAQMVVASYEHVKLNLVDYLGETKRGAGGFGSTGS